MDRRTFLTASGGLAAAVVTLGRTGLTVPAAAAVRPAASGLVWAADFSSATDSDGAGFGNVQYQNGGGDIHNGGDPIPVVDNDQLGRALRLHLNDNGERLEAEPGGAQHLDEGDDYYFRVDFAFDDDFPIGQSNYFCLINQIHDAGTSSPPVEFDVHDDALWVRGASTAYNERLIDVETSRKYSMIYRAKLSYTRSDCLLEVWIDGTKVLSDYTPGCALLNDGESYWKGASMYCSSSIPPLTVYQNAHKCGTTYESVAG